MRLAFITVRTCSSSHVSLPDDTSARYASSRSRGGGGGAVEERRVMGCGLGRELSCGRGLGDGRKERASNLALCRRIMVSELTTRVDPTRRAFDPSRQLRHLGSTTVGLQLGQLLMAQSSSPSLPSPLPPLLVHANAWHALIWTDSPTGCVARGMQGGGVMRSIVWVEFGIDVMGDT